MRRIFLAVLALGLLAGAVVINTERAYACSCRGISTMRAYDEADAAFAGTVRSLTETGSGNDRRVDIRFEVSQVYKGEVYASQLIASPPDAAGCGLTPEVGSTWTIFATQQVIGSGDRAITRLSTTLCAGNLPTATPPLTVVRPQSPRAGESDRTERSVVADERLSRVLVIAGFGGLGVAVLVGLGLVVVWRPRNRP